jgi:hypothetical protein
MLMVERNFGTGHLDLRDIYSLEGRFTQIARHLGERLGFPNVLGLRRKLFTQIARHLGERLGCPITPRLLEERNHEELAKRYAEIILYYQLLLDRVGVDHPRLYEQIINGETRKVEEIPKGYDEGWVPDWFAERVPGTETHWGYALPRLLISYSFGEASGTRGDKPLDRLVNASGFFDDVLDELGDGEVADELLLGFAEKLVVDGGADPRVVLRRTISAGKLELDSMHTQFSRVVEKMEENAPVLWGEYCKMTSDERNECGVADITVEVE